MVLRTPPRYVVPSHSHTYVSANGKRQKLEAPAYISLPGNAPPHTIECGDEPCVFYVRYSRLFDLQGMQKH